MTLVNGCQKVDRPTDIPTDSQTWWVIKAPSQSLKIFSGKKAVTALKEILYDMGLPLNRALRFEVVIQAKKAPSLLKIDKNN